MPCLAADCKPESIKVNQEQPELDLSTHVHELENCLQEVLSDVLKVEMKAAFDDLWLEVKKNTSFHVPQTIHIFLLHASVGIVVVVIVIVVYAFNRAVYIF